MKITKTQLKRLIKEELDYILLEQGTLVPGTDPSKMFGSAFEDEANAARLAAGRSDAEQWQRDQALRADVARRRGRGFSKADIRNMTPEDAAAAVIKYKEDTGGYESRGYNADVFSDLQDRALGQGSISAHETDPVVRGLAYGRKNYPIATKTAEFGGSFLPGVGEVISLADLRMTDDPVEEREARSAFLQNVAMSAIPGGEEYQYASEILGAPGQVVAAYDIGTDILSGDQRGLTPDPAASRLAILDKDLREDKS